MEITLNSTSPRHVTMAPNVGPRQTSRELPSALHMAQSRGGDYRGDGRTRPPNILVGGRKGKCPPLIAHLVKFLGHIFHLDKLDYCISGVTALLPTYIIPKCLYSIYTVSQKKQDTKLLPITSLNVNRFSKFFHWQTHW